MNVLVWLAAILFILMIVIGGKRSTVLHFLILKLWCHPSYHIDHGRSECKPDYPDDYWVHDH